MVKTPYHPITSHRASYNTCLRKATSRGIPCFLSSLYRLPPWMKFIVWRWVVTCGLLVFVGRKESSGTISLGSGPPRLMVDACWWFSRGFRIEIEVGICLFRLVDPVASDVVCILLEWLSPGKEGSISRKTSSTLLADDPLKRPVEKRSLHSLSDPT